MAKSGCIRKFSGERRSSTMVETAICLPVFLLLLFFIFELGYDAFIQIALEGTLQNLAEQIEVGDTISATSSNFVTTYACPDSGGLLGCKNLYIRVQNFSPSICKDYYTATNGDIPVDGNGVGLGAFVGASGVGGGDTLGSTACSTSGTTFCDPLPGHQTLLTAVYLAPSFLQGLIPTAAYRYSGHLYHVAYDTIGFDTENFSVANGEGAPCPTS